MRRQCLCLPEEYSCFLKGSFSAMGVEIWQGYAGVKIYPKYIPVKCIRKIVASTGWIGLFYLCFCYLHSLKNPSALNMPCSKPVGMLNRIVPTPPGTTVMLGTGDFHWDNPAEHGENQKNLLNSEMEAWEIEGRRKKGSYCRGNEIWTGEHGC